MPLLGLDWASIIITSYQWNIKVDVHMHLVYITKIIFQACNHAHKMFITDLHYYKCHVTAALLWSRNYSYMMQALQPGVYI